MIKMSWVLSESKYMTLKCTWFIIVEAFFALFSDRNYRTQSKYRIYKYI